jgi:hypothetical protein
MVKQVKISDKTVFQMPKNIAKWQLWLHKWLHWEYWPMWVANIPVLAIYLWFAFRSRRWFFFSAANPGLSFGGAFGVSKSAILQLLPDHLLPKSTVVMHGTPFDAVMAQMEAAGLNFPLIAKPNVGERGYLVQKVEHSGDLAVVLTQHPVDFILQEYVDLPCEMTVLFHRFSEPNPAFGITSVCQKAFLTVTGDGRRNIIELMSDDPRATIQIPRLLKHNPSWLTQVPESGKKVVLEPIGNHNRGTAFLDARHLINEPLVSCFAEICNKIGGIQYGRFDLRCSSPEDMQRGVCKVLELNGVFGEPAHVYSPGYGALRAYADFYEHWRIIYQLSRANIALGVRSAGWTEAWTQLKRWRQK